jgi:intraflagellar transport protein 172
LSFGLVINFGDATGSAAIPVDYSNRPELKGFTAATFDTSGRTALIAARNTLITFSYSSRLQTWDEPASLEFDGLYTIPDVSWSPDGSKIAVASVTGGLHIVTASIGGFGYKNLFEVVHISGSQLKVVDLQRKSELPVRTIERSPDC